MPIEKWNQPWPGTPQKLSGWLSGDPAVLQLCCVTLGKLLVLSEPMQNEGVCV